MNTTTLRLLIGTGLALLVVHLAAMEVLRKPDGRVVFGDATHHFVQLRSLVFDRDLDFRNEYTRIYRLQGGEPGTEWVTRDFTVTGHVRNYMPVGPALLWAPLYLLFAGVQWLLSVAGLAAAPDGYERLLQMAPGITGIVAVTAAAIVSWRTLRLRVAEPAATIAILATWLGSHAIYYSLVSPAYSHAASMFAASLFFCSWIDGRREVSTARIAGWGALAGFAALMRWQDALFLIVPLIEALRWRRPLSTRVLAAAAAVLAFVLVFSPQMMVWTVLYGQPLALPQGGSFMQWARPHPWAVLFSDNHGLFTWAPILIFAVAGLIGFVRREAGVLLPITTVVVATWYVNGAVADWWAGEAFGARRFLSLFPLFAIGLAWWLRAPAGQGIARWKLTTVGVLFACNWLLLLQYQVFMKGFTALAPYPGGAVDMWLTRFVVPFRLVARFFS